MQELDDSADIAAWLIDGINSWRELLWSPRDEVGEAAHLVHAGATELLRGVASLFFNHKLIPVTRAHLPIVRSIQEHAGRVVWLLDPEGTPDSRLDSLKNEHFDEMLEWARAEQNESEIARLIAQGAQSKTKRQRQLRGLDHALPSATTFANLADQKVRTLLNERPEDPKRLYRRLSETAHGNFSGLTGDATVIGDIRTFKTDAPSLRYGAARAGLLWLIAIEELARSASQPIAEFRNDFLGRADELFR